MVGRRRLRSSFGRVLLGRRRILRQCQICRCECDYHQSDHEKVLLVHRFLPYSDTRVGREWCPQLSITLTLQHARFQSSDIVYPSTGAGLELSLRSLTAVEPDFEKINSQGIVQWHTVSSVTCHVTWRVIEMQRATGFFKTKKTICSDCEQKPAIRDG